MKNNKKTSNLWNSKILKIIIALITAALLWFYVTATIGETVSDTFDNIEIVYKGADTIRDRDSLVITETSANSVSVTLEGSRRELSRLVGNQIELKAEIDVSNITAVGTYTVNYDLIYPADTDPGAINIVSSSPKIVQFYIDKTNTKTIELKGQFNGTVAEGYVSGPIEFEPSVVTITGPDSELANVEYAWVDIEREDVDKTLEFDTAYILVDSEGNEIELNNIKLQNEMVSVTLPVTSTKEVPLTVEFIEGSGATASNVKITCEPSTITIAGDAETLEGINSISLGTVDLTSFAATFEDSFPIVLDNLLSNVTGTREAKVTVQVVGLETSKFVLSNISAVNAPAGKTAEIVTQSIEVTIRGTEEALSNIQANNLRAVADLTDIGDTTGIFQTTVKIYVDGATDVGAIGEYSVYVNIE